MSDELKTVNKIVEDSKDIKFGREYRMRKLARIIPRTDCGMVKSHKIKNEITKDYMVFFKNRSATKGLQEAIDEGKTVFVTIKEVKGRWFVIKKEIRTPNVEIPGASLKEQTAEIQDLGNDY